MVLLALTIAGIGMALVTVETIVSELKGTVSRSENYEHPNAKGTAVCSSIVIL